TAYKAEGGRHLTVTDGAASATSDAFTVDPAATAALFPSAPSSAVRGTATSIVVKAIDDFSNTTPDYSDGVTLTSSDGAATLPGIHYYGGDNGTHTFSVTLRTLGP